ncbi:PH domain-containing protein [Euzebya sp.]|uniref:PH domain-containing protein n=1 Tax=Euzebya sp. TaxID=1971409 RepID=UPI0035136407
MSSASEPPPPPPPGPLPPGSPPPDGVPGPAAAPLGGQLHPSVIALWPLQQLPGLVIAFVLGGGPLGIGGLLAAGAGLLLVVGAAIWWNRFTWSVEGGTLVIEKGLIQRSRRVIPADRVQSVDLVTPLWHRAFGVVRVKVEAIGGSDTEGKLEALDTQTALALQAALIGARARAGRHARSEAQVEGEGGRSSPDAGAGSTTGAGAEDAVQGRDAQPRVLAQVSVRDLVVAGVTGGRIGVVAVIVGGAQQIVGDRIDDAIEAIPTDIGLVLGAILAVVAVLVVFGLSIAATVVAFWDFTISRDADELRISRGLIEHRLETVPLRRIQSLRLEQNALRRAFGLASVKADLAGRAGGEDAGTGLLLPIAPREDAERLIADLLGSDVPLHADLEGPPARSRRRYTFRGVVVGVVLGIAGGAAIIAGAPVWTPAVSGLMGLAVGIPLAHAYWRAIGRTEVEGVLVSRTGVLVRRRVHVPVGRVQRMAVQASPFQRRLRLADIEIGIARSGGWAGPRMLEVDADLAMALTADTVHDAVEASRRPARTG